MKKQIILLCLIALAVYSADQTLAPVPKMTAEEAAETVLADGAIVRIVDSSPSDLRVGDGQTPGGIRVGDGGWIEGEALTRDLYAAGHSILLGEGWQVHTLGGWTALSGGGELSVSNAAFRLSMYGTIFMESVSAEAAVHITRFAYVAPYFELETSLGTTKPTVLYSSNLISQTWTVCPVASVVTNAASYTFKISPTNFSTYVVFRASVPAGSGTYTDFTGELRENGIPVATAPELETLSTQSVKRVILNGVTNSGETIDLGTLSGGGISGTNVVLKGTLTLTNSTAKAWSVGYWTNSVAGVGTNGVYVRIVYTPAGTTNIYYSLYQ